MSTVNYVRNMSTVHVLCHVQDVLFRANAAYTIIRLRLYAFFPKWPPILQLSSNNLLYICKTTTEFFIEIPINYLIQNKKLKKIIKMADEIIISIT